MRRFAMLLFASLGIFEATTYLRAWPGEPAAARPLARAHAHNDYLHQRPLLDALDRGFTSVEADVFLVGGRLLVGHSVLELSHDRTLEKLYLDPLRERIRRGGGKLFADGTSLTLLVDIKADGEAAYQALAKTLAEYGEMISVVRDGRLQQKPVTVIVSGDRPWRTISDEKTRYVGLDGRLSDLDSTLPSHLLPLISDNWTSHFQWRGLGDMPQDEWGKLVAIVRQAHAAGRRVRFWATPDEESMWRQLHAAGVDLINTDDLEGLSRFLPTVATGKE